MKRMQAVANLTGLNSYHHQEGIKRMKGLLRANPPSPLELKLAS